MNLSPSITPSDSSGVFNLLALLADPAAAKARLEEIISATQKQEAANEEAMKLAAASSLEGTAVLAARDDLANELAALQKKLQQQQADLEIRERGAVAREQSLQLRATQLDVTGAAQGARAKELDLRESDLSIREQRTAEKEATLADLTARVASLQKTIDASESRLAAARKAVGA